MGELLYAPRALVGGHLEDVRKVGKVLHAGHELVDVGVVGHIGERALRCDGIAHHVVPADLDRAAFKALRSHDGADERCFAGAVMANEAVDVSRFHGEREVAHGDFVAIALLEIANGQDAHRGLPSILDN